MQPSISEEPSVLMIFHLALQEEEEEGGGEEEAEEEEGIITARGKSNFTCICP
jgi:hypothetical protein